MIISNGYKLIFILGGGHSGSTLLDMIIGSSTEAFSLGEIFFFDRYKGYQKPSYKLILGQVCSCGELIGECPFWTQISFDDKENILKVEKLGESFKILFNILNPFEKYFRFNVRIGKNHDLFNKCFLNAKKQKNELKYLMDSSKDPRRLYELVHDPKILNDNIFVIHLIRDGRGYINSYHSKKRAKLGLKVHSKLFYLFEWLLINFVSKRILSKYKVKNISISYDKFCQNPEEYLIKLNRTLGLTINTKDYLFGLKSTVFHNIHGNLMRFKGIDKIQYDVKWREQLDWLAKITLTICLYPFNRFWVYKKSE